MSYLIFPYLSPSQFSIPKFSSHPFANSTPPTIKTLGSPNVLLFILVSHMAFTLCQSFCLSPPFFQPPVLGLYNFAQVLYNIHIMEEIELSHRLGTRIERTHEFKFLFCHLLLLMWCWENQLTPPALVISYVKYKNIIASN